MQLPAGITPTMLVMAGGAFVAVIAVVFGLRALFGGRRNIVSGIFNTLSVFFMRFVPRRILVWATARTMGEPKATGSLVTANGR